MRNLRKSVTNLLAPSSSDITYIAELKRMKKNLNFSIMSKSTVLDPRFKDLKMIDKRQRNSIYDAIETEMYLLTEAVAVASNDVDSDPDDPEDVFDDEAKKEMDKYK